MPKELSESELMGKGANLNVSVPQLENATTEDELLPEEQELADVIESSATDSTQPKEEPPAQKPVQKPVQKPADEHALEVLTSLFSEQPAVAPRNESQDEPSEIDMTDEEFEGLVQNKKAFLNFIKKTRAADRVDLMKRVIPVLQEQTNQQLFAQRVSSEFYGLFPELRSKGREVTAEINKIRMLQPELPMQAVLVQTARNLGAFAGKQASVQQQQQQQSPRKAPARTVSARRSVPATPETAKAQGIRRVVFNK